MDVAPPTDFPFIELLLAFRSVFPPFLLSAHEPQEDPAIMRSLLLVLAALPLTSLALIIGRNNGGPDDPCNNNGTGSSQYQLQKRHKGKTFFKYAQARSFFSSPC